MRFKVGDKVIVKSFSERPDHWNISGKMDKWMGKIVTILKYRESDINPYLIEEDKGENLGGRWHWRESDFLPIPKPGDKVKIRTWEDMEKQYGTDVDNDIKAPSYRLVEGMKRYCGTTQVVNAVMGNAFEISTNFLPIYSWGFETIEEVYPKEEKMEFTKDMLKNGEHVVEYRNGDKRLYLNSCFVGFSQGTHSCEFTNDLRNAGPGGDKLDIMAVYRASKMLSFKDILDKSTEVIWKRDEEPIEIPSIEIPSSEAFAKLREIYGSGRYTARKSR